MKELHRKLLIELTCRCHSLCESIQDLGPDEHPSIGHPRDVDLLGVHAEPVQDVVEDGLGVGDVIVAGDPVTGAVRVVAVSVMPEIGARGVARTPVIPEVITN